MPITKQGGDMFKSLYDKDGNSIVDVPAFSTVERLALPTTTYAYFVFDTDLEECYVYNHLSDAWNTVGSTPSLASEASPTLSGDLNLGGNDITGFPDENKGKGIGVDENGKMKKLEVTNAELEYLSGAVENIQTQLNNRPIIEVGATPPDDTSILWYDTN